MPLDNVVKITITRSAAPVTRQGFGTALILGSAATGWGSDRVRTYTDPDDMLDDGFVTSDMEYKQAVELYSQPVKPVRFKVGRSLTPVAQVTTITPDVTTQATQHFIVNINGVDYDFESDASPTAGEVVSGLAALINAGTEPVTASGTDTLVLTSDVSGLGFSVTITANLTGAMTTPNVGVESDLADIDGIDSDWYALILCSRNADFIMGAATYIESKRKIFLAASEDAGIATAGTTDIGSRLKAKGYNRTALLYSTDQESGPEGAALGNILPLTVGAWTLKFKTLVGITPDSLSGTAYTNIKAKNVNVYTTVAGSGMVEDGVVVSAEFLDTIVGVDWIDVNMQADVFQVLKDNTKIPYNNAGTNAIVSAIDARLRLATVAGILDAERPYSVTAPLAADQDPADRATRKIAGIKFKAYLAAAVHSTEISGNVSV